MPPSRSALFITSMVRDGQDASSAPSPAMSSSTFITSARCAAVSGWAASRTCKMTSAWATSSNVARKASTSSCGNSLMKPTVSDKITRRPDGRRSPRIVGSKVANSWSLATTSAPVRALNNVDLPELVYPTSATTGKGTRLRAERWRPRVRRTCSRSFFSRTRRSSIKRLSASICVSPGPPRKPKPPRCRSKWVQDRTRRERWYSRCASSTWSVPSLVAARSPKISKINPVRSITLQPQARSRLRCCTGVSIASTMTTVTC